MKLLLITIVLLALAFAGIAIKIWAKKDGEFEGTCSGSNAKLRAKGITCGCGGEGSCHNKVDEQQAVPQIQVKKLS
ncbi:MAG: membrane or secreted protein [Bacteroidota bacterium]